MPTKVRLGKAMVFPGVMYGCWSWTIKKVEHWRIDAFELWCWRRLLRVPWTARRSNQSILRKSILNTHWKDWCWSWNQHFGHLMRTDSLAKMLFCCWERLKVRGEADTKGWDGWMASPMRWTWVCVGSRSWIGKPGVLQSMGSQRVGHDWAIELNWTELNWNYFCNLQYIFIERLFLVYYIF